MSAVGDMHADGCPFDRTRLAITCFVAWLEPVASPMSTPWSSHIWNAALPTVAPFILTLRVTVTAGEWTDMVESMWLTPLTTEVLALKDHRLVV